MTISVQLGTGLVQISVHRKRVLLKVRGFAASSGVLLGAKRAWASSADGASRASPAR